MSTDLIAQIQADVLAAGGGVDADTRAVAGTAYGKRLSIKGSVFRKFEGGKEVAAIEDRHLNVIFVKMAPTPARNYYAQAFKEGENISPVCWSSDTKTPDASVKTPQSRTCAECRFSVKGSGVDGTGTACRLSWRTAVVLPQDPGGDILQLVLPATSAFGNEENGKWPFRAYIQMLASKNISANRVITKMQFDTKAATPKLLFTPVAAVPPEHIAIVQEQSDSAIAAAQVELRVFDAKKKESPAPAAALPPAAAEISEPTVRKADKHEPEEDNGKLEEIVKKWAKK